LVRLLRYSHRHVSRYAPLAVPCRRTQFRRNLVELLLTVTLIAMQPATSPHLRLLVFYISDLSNYTVSD